MAPAGPDSEAVVIHPEFKKLRDVSYVRGRRKEARRPHRSACAQTRNGREDEEAVGVHAQEEVEPECSRSPCDGVKGSWALLPFQKVPDLLTQSPFSSL